MNLLSESIYCSEHDQRRKHCPAACIHNALHRVESDRDKLKLVAAKVPTLEIGIRALDRTVKEVEVERDKLQAQLKDQQKLATMGMVEASLAYEELAIQRDNLQAALGHVYSWLEADGLIVAISGASAMAGIAAAKLSLRTVLRLARIDPETLEEK